MANVKHGHCADGTQTSEYLAYRAARKRCTNPKDKDYPDYGGRGIKFLFVSFEQFLVALGKKPTPEHQLDRKDNGGNYEPGNVRWATRSQQMLNRRQYHRRLKIRCLRNHLLSGVNLYVSPGGVRQCRICQRAGEQRYRNQKKEAACHS